MPVVELAGVTKAYENKVAVSNLNLSIDAGHVRFGAERGGQNQLHWWAIGRPPSGTQTI